MLIFFLHSHSVLVDVPGLLEIFDIFAVFDGFFISLRPFFAMDSFFSSYGYCHKISGFFVDLSCFFYLVFAMISISFLGGTGTVTGSKYLVTFGKRKILVDCGLFQGFKQLRLRNWSSFPIHPKKIDAVILTHAHIDHSGYLPLLVKNGFDGPVYCTPATRDLCAILLPDSGYLQEEEARYANKKGFSKHHPALPLYTIEDGQAALNNFHPISFYENTQIIDGVSVHFVPAGHILGSAVVTLIYKGQKIVFTGDLGRLSNSVMNPPDVLQEADYLVCESTYGDRLHEKTDPETKLAQIINDTVLRGGIVVIPSFAVGRAQTLLYHIHQLRTKDRIPNIPVYLNSPMAVDVSQLFCKYHEEHRLTEKESRAVCETATYVHSAEESKELNTQKKPMIVIAGSGMATGGRVVHHLKSFVSDSRNTILFAGFQAGGTRGEAMINGAESIKIHGQYYPVKAQVKVLNNLSAHADYSEILTWLKNFKKIPKKIFLTHGEPAASDFLRKRIEEELKWPCLVPEYLQEIELI